MVMIIVDYNLFKWIDVYVEVDFNWIIGGYIVFMFMGVKGNKLGGGVGFWYCF